MEKARLILLAVGICVAGSARGCGPFTEEPAPTLPFYIHRLPAKSAREIHDEITLPKPNDFALFRLRQEVLDLTNPQLHKPDELAVELQKQVESARAAAAPAAVRTLLLDLRDVSKQPGATVRERTEYIQWRLQQVEWFGFSWERGAITEDRWAERDEAKAKNATTALEEKLAAATPAMQPFWMYLRGAFAFRQGDDTDSQKWFERVGEKFPESAKAEAALFMAARCQLSRSRYKQYGERNVVLIEQERPRVLELLEAYLAKYPQGDYAGDATGWLGAYYFDGGEYVEALRRYVAQTEMKDHPELLGPALEMCEKMLKRIAAEPDDDGALGEVAKHPEAAMSLLYFIVNTTEADNFDGKLDDPEQVTGWRRKILPRLAAAVAAEEARYRNPAWQPRYLALLAGAASGAGRQDQALRLTELPMEQLAANDDLLMARGVALQRARRFHEAIETYRTLLEKFPHSALASGIKLRLALTLLDEGEHGLALVELLHLQGKQPAKPDANAARDETDDDPAHEERDHPTRESAEPEQIVQLIDTILNFAPLPKIVAVANDSTLPELDRLHLRQVLAQRYLAHEQFAEAKKYVTPAQWELAAARIEKLSNDVTRAKGAARARIGAELAGCWAAARGQLLTILLDSDEYRQQAGTGNAIVNDRRIENADALGFVKNLNTELENRDELRHAFNWWLEAADAEPKSPAAATALWNALKAMPKLADVSPFTMRRAHEKNYNDVSRKLYDRLRTDFPHSSEARCAVYWDFPEVPKAKEDDYTSPREPIGGATSGSAIFKVKTDDSDYQRSGWAEITRKTFALVKNAEKTDPARLTREVVALQAAARQQVSQMEDTGWLNFFDDLALFLQQPDPGPKVRARYLQLRLACLQRSCFGGWPELHPGEQTGYDEEPDGVDRDARLRKEIRAAIADPLMQPIRDFLEFLDLAVVANHLTNVPVHEMDKDGESFTYRSRDYPLLKKMTAQFLKAHPNSAKREAALLLNARAVFMESRPRGFDRPTTWPNAQRWEGGVERVRHSFAPFDAAKIKGALEAYESEFPKGKYLAEIRDYRGALALRTRDLQTALRLTMAQFDDAEKPELQENAADRLAEIFELLADEKYRPDLLAKILSEARARALLGEYLEDSSDSHPLLYMRKYLQDRLSAAASGI